VKKLQTKNTKSFGLFLLKIFNGRAQKTKRTVEIKQTNFGKFNSVFKSPAEHEIDKFLSKSIEVYLRGNKRHLLPSVQERTEGTSGLNTFHFI